MKNYKTTTFEELLNTVPSVDEGTLPKANNLPESEVLITKECDDFKITVYKNGLFVYAEGKRTTVFAVDRCASYVDPVDTSEKHIPYDDIKNLEWYFPLMIFGMSRMEINKNRQNQEHEAYSLNNDGTDYSVYDESVEDILREAEEKREYEEKMRARRSKMMAEQEVSKREKFDIFRFSPVYTDTVKRDIQKRYYLKYPTIAYQIGKGTEYEILNVNGAIKAMVDWCSEEPKNTVRIIKDEKRMWTPDYIKSEKEAGRAKMVVRVPVWMVNCGYAVLKGITGENKYTYLLNKAVHPLRSE